MAEQTVQESRREKVSVFLKQHEQWSAWGFYTLMSGLILYCTSHTVNSVLMAPLIGIMQLYALKLCSLYVRRSTAAAIAGLYFAATPFYTIHPGVLCMCLQVVVLYHVLVWARGKRQEFRPRHIVVLGLSVGITLLLLPAAAVFYAPVAALMLRCNSRSRLLFVAILTAAVALPLYVLFSRSWNPAAIHPSIPGISSALAIVIVLLLFLPGAVAIRRSRPERRYITLGLLALAWVLAIPQPPGWTYFYPLCLPSLLGLALLLHRKVTDRRLRYLLRAFGLLLPFITLCATLVLPIYRQANPCPASPTTRQP